ncbi:unnamed protein product, partial [Polarella glacialis]
ASSSCPSDQDQKDLTSVLIKPDRVPPQPVRLLEQELSFRHLTVCHCLRGVPDVDLLRDAFQRALSKNPVLAGRLRPFWLRTGGRRPDGLEIGFDGALGCPFQVRPMSPDVEDEVERLDTERYARQFLRVHSELAEELRIGRVCFGLDLIGNDLPLGIVTFCPGRRVSVIALSISRILGEASAIYGLLRCWDEEFSSPGSSSSLSGGGGAVGIGREVVLRLLKQPIFAIQAIHEALDGVRHWVYHTTVWGFGGCCTARGGNLSSVSSRISLLAPVHGGPGGHPGSAACGDHDDDAPEGVS